MASFSFGPFEWREWVLVVCAECGMLNESWMCVLNCARSCTVQRRLSLASHSLQWGSLCAQYATMRICHHTNMPPHFVEPARVAPPDNAERNPETVYYKSIKLYVMPFPTYIFILLNYALELYSRIMISNCINCLRVIEDNTVILRRYGALWTWEIQLFSQDKVSVWQDASPATTQVIESH